MGVREIVPCPVSNPGKSCTLESGCPQLCQLVIPGGEHLCGDAELSGGFRCEICEPTRGGHFQPCNCARSEFGARDHWHPAPCFEEGDLFGLGGIASAVLVGEVEASVSTVREPQRSACSAVTAIHLRVGLNHERVAGVPVFAGVPAPAGEGLRLRPPTPRRVLDVVIELPVKLVGVLLFQIYRVLDTVDREFDRFAGIIAFRSARCR